MKVWNYYMRFFNIENIENKQLKLVVNQSQVVNILEYYSNIKLEYLKNRKIIWEIIQKKISKIITNTHLNQLSYAELLEYLTSCNNFVQIGEDYSNSNSKQYFLYKSCF